MSWLGGGWYGHCDGIVCPDVPAERTGAQPDATIQCIHCPHVEQWHISGVVEGTKRGCLSCDECPGFERAGAQVPSQVGIPSKLTLRQENALRAELGRYVAHLNSIKSYAAEAAKTPITRESILAAPQGDDAPIPDDLRKLYYLANDGDGYPVPAKTVTALIERIANLEAELEARKLHELAQFDEMQGLRRLILSETKEKV